MQVICYYFVKKTGQEAEKRHNTRRDIEDKKKIEEETTKDIP